MKSSRRNPHALVLWGGGSELGEMLPRLGWGMGAGDADDDGRQRHVRRASELGSVAQAERLVAVRGVLASVCRLLVYCGRILMGAGSRQSAGWDIWWLSRCASTFAKVSTGWGAAGANGRPRSSLGDGRCSVTTRRWRRTPPPNPRTR